LTFPQNDIRPPFERKFLGGWPACGTKFPARHQDHYRADQTWPKHDKLIEVGRRLIAGATCSLIGPRGTGKTQVACWLANRLRETGYISHTYYFTAADLFGLMKSWYALPCYEKGMNDRQIHTVPMLVIDEMQERVESEHEDKMLTQVIDKRYGERLPTLLIANIRREEMQAKLGASVVSRLTEGGLNVLCDWPSYRVTQSQSVSQIAERALDQIGEKA
jgi:DNA replication protein DnaC